VNCLSAVEIPIAPEALNECIGNLQQLKASDQFRVADEAEGEHHKPVEDQANGKRHPLPSNRIWGGIFALTGEMRMLARWVFISLILLAASFTMLAQGAPPQVTNSTEATAVADTMRAMYVAAATDDLAKFRSLIAPGFYAFDNGKRYDGDALMQMVISAHAKGMKIVWNVTEPDAHIHDDYAWIAYTNVGSIQMSAAAESTPVKWLESACLERHNSSWKIVFFQSSRVPAPPPSGSR
jgi:SnoaL-like domain